MKKTNSFHCLSVPLALSALLIGVGSAMPAHADDPSGQLKVAARQDICMDLASNSVDIELKGCNGNASQKWYYVDFNGGVMIKNEARGERYCLRSYPSGSVNMDSCSGSGYSSSRTWYNKIHSDGSYEISNKFINDLGRKNHLLQSVKNKVFVQGVASQSEKSWLSVTPLPLEKLRKVTGEKKIALLVTHYDGDKPANTDTIAQAVFGQKENFTSLRQFVNLASENKLNLTGEVFDNINLGPKPNHCNLQPIRALINNKAKEKGINLDQYDYVFTELTANKKCNYSGLAAMPGNWILSNASGHKYWMWSHEFGHNLGFNHIKSLQKCTVSNKVVQVDNKCDEMTKNSTDITDTMGGGGGHLYPVNYQYLLGWLDEAQVPLISKFSDLYNLSPVWQNDKTQGIKGLRIPRNDGSFMILEYRQPQTGFEDWAQNDPVVNGVTVRTYKLGSGTVQNTIIDTTPGSRAAAQDTRDAQLTVGKSLYDALSNKMITVVSADRNGAVIKVESVSERHDAEILRYDGVILGPYLLKDSAVFNRQ
ncbi:hypothetical protein [Erwinia tasmaniensis]|uniref:hypothetical protein n=1 Tax=Erwinia tasmaniensis TaxID=338565 RepID=UPI003A4DC8A6